MTVFLFLNVLSFGFYLCYGRLPTEDAFVKQNYVFWPNASVPFYINSSHFDREQSISIMTSLAMFAFKTCIKFAPVMAEPKGSEHVLVFENPGAIWKCTWSADAFSIDEPHRVKLGYDCLKSPKMEMTIMKALGFPFEHNRASRDLFIDVQYENIEPSAMELFTKDAKLPPELRNLPYDVNSAMHFGDRYFSKNGHRTIIFKDRNVKQNRAGVSDIDLRKIETVYGPECQKRDRQEKIDLCQIYPGAARRKRDATLATENLRVNRDITPPPNKNLTEEVAKVLNELGIEKEVEDIIEQVYKTVAIAVQNAKTKYCNNTKAALRDINGNPELVVTDSSVLKIIDAIAKFTQSFINVSIANLTAFCNTTDNIAEYQRAKCYWGSDDPRCPKYYKSTKTGNVKHHTQHRPTYYQSTKHAGQRVVYQYERSRVNNTDENSNNNITAAKNETAARRKREAHREIENIEDLKTQLKSNKVNVTKEGEDLKEDKTDKIAHVSSSKKMLRSATTVKGSKNKHYASFRRSNNKRYRIFSRKEESSDENLSKSPREVKKINEMQKDVSKEDLYENNKSIGYTKQYKYIMRGKTKDGIPKTVPLSKKNKEFYADRKWPGGIIRYIITDYDQYDLQDLRNRIDDVNEILTKKTCVRLEEITEDEAQKYRDYLVLDTSPDYVTGRVGGRQVFGSVELFKGVSHKQHTAMMVMAMLGFYFEVSRHDRDEHIVVHPRHIRPDKLHHFEKLRSDATLPLAYDYSSATHPSWQFWRKIGKTGISSVATFKEKDPDGSIMKSLGQNPQLLSNLDIVKINSVYGVKCFKKLVRNDDNNE